MFAYVKDGVVRETCRNESPFNIFFPEYAAMFIPCPDTVEQGDLYDGENWTKPPVVVTAPASVTRRQAKQALLLAGLLDQVQPAIDAIQDATQRALVQIEWDDSQEFERQRPALISLAGALGLDDAALDSLFISAAAL